MKNTSKILSAAAFVVSLACTFVHFCSVAHADFETELSTDTRAVASVRAGLDSAMALTGTYARRISPTPTERDLMFFGALTLPAGSADFGDTHLEAGTLGTAYRHRHFGLQLSLSTTLRNTQTNVFSANAIGAQVAVLPGYRTKRWGIVGDLSYEKVVATHLRHSALYTHLVYEDAKSGWYRSSAGTLRAGARIGVRIGAVTLGLQLGRQWSEGGAPALPPVYATLGAGFAM